MSNEADLDADSLREIRASAELELYGEAHTLATHVVALIDELELLRGGLQRTDVSEIAVFLRRRALLLVAGFYPNWEHVGWLRESADKLDQLDGLVHQKGSVEPSLTELINHWAGVPAPSATVETQDGTA